MVDFVKRCFIWEAVVVKEVWGWEDGWEYKVRRVQASYAEKGDWVVHSSLVIVTLGRVALMGVFYIPFVKLYEPVNKEVKCPTSERARRYFD